MREKKENSFILHDRGQSFKKWQPFKKKIAAVLNLKMSILVFLAKQTLEKGYYTSFYGKGIEKASILENWQPIYFQKYKIWLSRLEKP